MHQWLTVHLAQATSINNSRGNLSPYGESPSGAKDDDSSRKAPNEGLHLEFRRASLLIGNDPSSARENLPRIERDAMLLQPFAQALESMLRVNRVPRTAGERDPCVTKLHEVIRHDHLIAVGKEYTAQRPAAEGDAPEFAILFRQARVEEIAGVPAGPGDARRLEQQ